MARVLLEVDFIRDYLFKVCETNDDAVHIPP